MASRASSRTSPAQIHDHHPVLRGAPPVERILDEDPDTAFVEIGGGTTLLSLVRQIRGRRLTARP
ncbi:hypothetical protein ACRAWF_30540 [Streptomyces sp. L7]